MCQTRDFRQKASNTPLLRFPPPPNSVRMCGGQQLPLDGQGGLAPVLRNPSRSLPQSSADMAAGAAAAAPDANVGCSARHSSHVPYNAGCRNLTSQQVETFAT